MIIVNGAKKSGTHALLRAVDLFDIPTDEVKHSHVPFARADIVRHHKHIHISRNPRNVLISKVRRTTGDDVTEAVLMEWMPVVLHSIRTFLPWTKSGKCLNVRFEELITDPSIIEKISDYIGLPLREDHFKLIWGRTHTSTGNLSKWQDHWTDGLEKMWFDLGGHALETVLSSDPRRKYIRRKDG